MFAFALRAYRRWSLDEVARLRIFFGQGADFADIASQLGRSVHSVRGKASQLGLIQSRVLRGEAPE